MMNQRVARLNLQRARVIEGEAEHLRAQGAWNLVVRRCQETVELALKGTLLWAGINVPRIHDVGGILRQHEERFPAEFQQVLSNLASISRSLRAERELAFYGDEESGLPPEILYVEGDADEALEKARFVLLHVERLVSGEQDGNSSDCQDVQA
jgi:HEPN domain-containing protein